MISFAGAESGSEHPLAAAMIRFVREALGCGTEVGETCLHSYCNDCVYCQVGKVEESKTVPGCGLAARVSKVEAMVETALGLEQMQAYQQWRRQGSEGEYQLAGASIDCGIVRRGSRPLVQGLESLISLQDEGGRGEQGIAVAGEQVSYSVLVGNREWMARNAVVVKDEVEAKLSREEELGRTAVIMVVEGRVLAVLGIADTVKPEANLTVFTLKKAGLDVILLTGDNRKTAAAIARQAKFILI